MKNILEKIPERLKSRKFWVAIITAGVIALGLPESLVPPVVLIVMTYLGVQGAQDLVKESKK